MEARNNTLELYIEPIESSMNPSLINGVVSGELSFFGMVKDFYGISYGFEHYSNQLKLFRPRVSKKRDLSKYYRSPTQLIDLTSKFSDKEFDESKLTYEVVLDDLKRWYSPTRMIYQDVRKNLCAVSGLTTCFSGMAAITTVMKEELPTTSLIVCGISAAIMGLTLNWPYLRAPRKTDYAFDEFITLASAAHDLAELIKETYPPSEDVENSA